jgi:hypothetical protein
VTLIKPVNPCDPITLPPAWQVLERQELAPSLILRARGFLLRARRDGPIHERVAWTVLRWTGEGFLRPFDAQRMVIKDRDPDAELKRQALRALAQLAQEFNGLIPSVVWESYAYLFVRTEPTKHATILSRRHELPFAWWLVDTVLHATPKAYDLMLHIQSRLFEGTGCIVNHGCDCGCDIQPLIQGACVRYRLDPAYFLNRAEALLSHLFSEGILLGALHYPSELGVSPEASEAIDISLDELPSSTENASHTFA